MIELPERKEVGALLRFVCGLSAFHTFIFASKEKQRLRRPSFSLHKYTRSRSLSFSRPFHCTVPGSSASPKLFLPQFSFPTPSPIARLGKLAGRQVGLFEAGQHSNDDRRDDDEKTETERGRGESEETGESVERASERESRERRGRPGRGAAAAVAVPKNLQLPSTAVAL